MLLLFLLLLDPSVCKELRWKYDADISHSANWIGEKPAKNCIGVHFSPVNSAPVFVDGLSTQELILPRDGEIDILDGSAIEFFPSKKCILLKPIDYHDWYDDDSWETDANAATPDLEKIPCDHDDVTFPNVMHTRVLENYGSLIPIRSIKLGVAEKTDVEMSTLMDTKIGQKIFYNPIDPFTFYVTGRSCRDPQGCFCHKENIPCPVRKYPTKTTCLNPVQPENFCHEICGAYVTFKPKAGFRLADLREQLKKYASDTHASRVMDYLGDDVVQVVFTEKEYTGASVEEAQRFFDRMQKKELPVEGARIEKSGKYHVEGEGSPVLGIVFGTFVAVAAFFAVLLYLNGDTRLDLIISRFNKGRGSVFTVPFFARFDNTDENLIIESQSVAGSVLDLPKSFDNPLFGQPSDPGEENPLSDVKLKERDDEE